jgi:hypothetical protein
MYGQTVREPKTLTELFRRLAVNPSDLRDVRPQWASRLKGDFPPIPAVAPVGSAHHGAVFSASSGIEDESALPMDEPFLNRFFTPPAGSELAKAASRIRSILAS